MEHIFICYSRKDQELALNLKEALKQFDKEVWIDLTDLPASSIWRKEIQDAITQCIAFIYLVSTNSLGSEYCQKEFELAIQQNKRVFPILLPGTIDKDIPEIISARQWLYWQGIENEIGLRKLITDIETDYEWVRFTTDLETRANRWKPTPKNTSSLLRGEDLQKTEAQLASSGNRDPQPTDLQRQYVLAGRKDEVRRQRRTTIGVTIGFIAVSVFCVAAVVASVVAVIQRNIAVSNENARATAQTNAEEQANIALARQLAAQAQLLSTQADTGEQTIQSGLLAIESLRINPSIQADQALRNTISSIGTPVHILEGKFYLSNDATFLVTVEENIAVISKTDTQSKIYEVNHDAEIIDAHFSNDGKLLFTLDSNGTVKVTNFESKNSRAINLSNRDNTNIISSADGGHLAAWSIHRNQVEIFNFNDGEFLHQVIQDKGEDVSEVKFSPNTSLIATSSFYSGFVDIWETATGKHIKSIQYPGNVTVIEFSPDSKYIAVGETSGAHILEAISGKEICRISLDLVVQAHFSSDGQRIVIATGVSGHGEADVLDIFQCKEISKMNHHDAVTEANFNMDETMVISSGIDGTARVWNVVTGEEASRIVHDKEVFVAKFIRDTDMVISISGSDSESQTAIIWYPKSHEARTLHHDAEVTSIAFSPDGTKFVTGTNTGVVSLWDIAFGKLIYQFHQDSFIEQVYFLPDNNRIVASSNRGTISVWDVHTGSNLIKFGPDATITTSTVSLDGRYMVSGDAYGNAIAWEISTGKELAHKKHADAVWVVAFNPNGKWVASVGNDDLVSVWDIQTSKEITSYYHDFWVNDIHFSPDGTLVISSSNDKTSRIWDIQNSKELARFTLDNTVWVSVFNPNAEIIASGSADSTARLWKTYTGSEIHRFQHESWVGEITFSQDGRWMITGTINGIMRIWNVVTFQEYSNFQVNQVISDLRFSPDENYIATPINENDVYIWSWKHEYLIEKLCYLLPRNLTTEEWGQYFGNIEYHATCPNLPTPTN